MSISCAFNPEEVGLIFCMCDNALNITAFLPQQHLSQGSRFPGAMRSLKDRSALKMFQVEQVCS